MNKYDSKKTMNLLSKNYKEYLKRFIFPSMDECRKKMLFRKSHLNSRTVEFKEHNLVFYIDDEHNSFAYMQNNVFSRWYGFCDITNVTLNMATHDKHSSSSDGYILHPPGSVGLIYSDTNYNVETYVDKMVLTIYINDPDYPEVNITYLDFSCKSSSATFANIYKEAQEKLIYF